MGLDSSGMTDRDAYVRVHYLRVERIWYCVRSKLKVLGPPYMHVVLMVTARLHKVPR